ncbi:PTS sugar transporter subunit IIC [Amphibacillus jilinensis]|uniref:PTS sugar transporter subunit IIC n=1 Tax=Amphibacillus jilinensis TaxID=1216008 RepID=UPI00030AC348|nr:PTS transporter subunit EIIC [Amphibacillus jilinensis]
MGKFNSQEFSKKLSKKVNKIQKSKIVNGITNGMMGALPITLVGAFAALFINLPLEFWQSFIDTSGIRSVLEVVIMFSTDFLAVIFAVAIASNYAKQLGEDGVTASLITLMSFFIVTPVTDAEGIAIPMHWLGGFGIFTGIIVALVATKIYVVIKQKGITIKMPSSVPPVVSNSFSGLIPGIIAVMFFAVVSVAFEATPLGSLHDLIYTFLQIPLEGLGANVFSVIILWTIAQLLWFFGIHGTLVVYSVVLPIFTAMDAAQLSAYAAGDPLPNIVGRAFISTYTMSASAIGLTLLMLFVAKSKQYKALGKLTTIPALFGISEPLVFGVPLVFNFKFAIPFIFMNAISISVAYFLTFIELIPRVNGIAPITGMPIVIGGFVGGSWRIAALQVALVALQVLVWYPFFKKADRAAFKKEQDEEVAAETV